MLIAPLVLLAAQARPVPSIEVYTMGQGEHLFERYGHAAICVDDGSRARCYNYGTTDFGSPPQELGWRFLRGSATFWVSVWPRQRMLRAYERADRSIWRQRLELEDDQARAIAAYLERDALPENREYLYHHFRDNCSTRLRDIINESTGGFERAKQDEFGATYRELGRRGIAAESAGLVFGDLLVGRGADHPLSYWDAMFLPRVLRHRLEADFGARPVRLYQRRGGSFPSQPKPFASWLIAAASLVGGCSGLLAATKRVRPARALVGIVLALLGVVVWGVFAVSKVVELRANEQLILFWPTDLLLVWSSGVWQRRYLWLRLGVALACAFLLAVGVLIQPLWPWIALLAIPCAALLLGLRRGAATSGGRFRAD